MPRTTSKPDIDSALVHKLAKLLDETGLAEIEYGTQDWHLRVAKGASGPIVHTVAAAPATPEAGPAEAEAETDAEALADHPGVLISPMVGVAYTLPEPDSPPLVKVGDAVAEGQTVLLIEAMKVFNPIKAPRAGTVTRILVANGAPVEYGEPLMIIE